MKQIAVWFVGLLLVSEASAQEEDMSKFGVDQVFWISLRTSPTLWDGVFYRNGSAELKWGGSGSFDMAIAPKGSFSFEEVYNLLIPHLKRGRDRRDDTGIVLVADPKTSMGGCLVNTEETRAIVRALMFELRDKASPSSKEIFEERLARYPLLQGDEPVPYVYKNFDRRGYWNARKDTEDPAMWEGWMKWREDEIKRVEAIQKAERGQASAKAEAGFSDTTKRGDEEKSPPIRPWLYAALLAVLCAVALWIVRRKR